MKSLIKTCLLATLLASVSAMANDPFLELDKAKRGVSVTRERSVMDYAAINALKSQDPHGLRMLVTTGSLTPDAETYAIAESFFEGLKQSYPLTEFKVYGRTDNRELAKMVRENYDYAFIVEINQTSNDYDRDETIYGSRSSGVNCTRSAFNSDVSCRETGAQRVPIGTRKGQSTIFTDIIFANYGEAHQVSASWSDTNFNNPGLSISLPIGHVAVVIKYGQSDASWCQDELGAQAALAQLTGSTVVSTRPDKISFNVDPEDIGCGG